MINRNWLRAGLIAAAMGFMGVSTTVYAGPGGGGTTGTEPSAAQRIVGRAVRAMADASRKACQDIRENTARAGRAIARADRNNATDDQITAIGTNSKQRNSNRTTTAAARIEELKTRALAALASNAGTDAQIARINDAAARATAHVNECRGAAGARIDAAVARATADDSGGGG